MGFGVGALDASIAAETTFLYFSGDVADITPDIFYGPRTEFNIGIGEGLTFGLTGTYSRPETGRFVIGIGSNMGYGVMPFFFSLNLNWGAAGAYGNNIGDDIRDYF